MIDTICGPVIDFTIAFIRCNHFSTLKFDGLTNLKFVVE